jgi:hypothetical protein
MLESSQVTAVLVAESFNLNIFQPLWLVDNGIVEKSEIENGTNFNTPVAANFTTDKFDLLVVPERVQLSFNNGVDNAEADINRIIGGIISKLPHTPFTAIGLNFNYMLTSNDEVKFVSKVKKLFLSDSNPLVSEFNSDDVRAGMYVSKDVFDSRFRMDIKPIIKSDGKEAIQLNCNVHKNIASVEDIVSFISKIAEMHVYADSLLKTLDQALKE